MGPFLLSEEEQEKENLRQLEAISKQVPGSPAGISPKPPKPPKPQRYRPPGAFGQRPFTVPTTGLATPMIDTHALLAAGQAAQAQRMSQDTNDAIRDEMDRRVAISREQRRMAHELEKKRMDQETERMKVEALLKRLEMESGVTTIYH